MASPIVIKAFHPGDKVTIDGSGLATVVKHDGEGNVLCTIDGIEYEIEVLETRLKLVGTSKKPGGQTSASERSQRPNADSRFVDVDDNAIDELIKLQENKNTARKTLHDMKLVNQYLLSVAEIRQIHDIQPKELNTILCKFAISVRKEDGSEFETNTLRGIGSSVERHLRRHNYGYSLQDDFEFQQYQDVMKARQKQLKSMGKGNLPNRCDAITDGEIEKLWESKQLGNASPNSILNTLWFNNTVHFGLRGSDEHKKMLWGDVELRVDSNGSEFLDFTESGSKTRQDADPKGAREVTPKLWAIPDNKDRCPVETYKLYRSLRPGNYCSSDSPFYVACSTVKNPGTGPWFKRQTVGIHKLETIMKRMAQASGLSSNKKLTNHSARKHLVQKLNNSNVPPSHIMQISGHKNIHSINSYSHINSEQHKAICSILSSSKSTALVPRSTEVNRDVNMTDASIPRYSEVGHVGTMPPALPSTCPSTIACSSMKRDHISSVFGSNNISGGTFTININYGASKKRRIAVIESDTDSD